MFTRKYNDDDDESRPRVDHVDHVSRSVTFNEQLCGIPQLTIMCKLVTKLCTDNGGGVIDVSPPIDIVNVGLAKYINAHIHIYIYLHIIYN